MPTFKYGDTDFGADNNDNDHFRSFVEVIVLDLETPVRLFAFPGVNAEFVQHLGVRGQERVWQVDMVADARSYLTAFEDAIEAMKSSAATYGLYEREDFYERVLLASFERAGPLTAMQAPWAWLQRYTLRFRVLP